MSKYKNKAARLGFTNKNNQSVVGAAPEYFSNHDSAKPWQLYCLFCKNEYGANGCDIHIRKCPKCQNGKAGLNKV
jgi:hypothetical protein